MSKVKFHDENHQLLTHPRTTLNYFEFGEWNTILISLDLCVINMDRFCSKVQYKAISEIEIDDGKNSNYTSNFLY